MDRASLAESSNKSFAAVFKSKTRDEWCKIMEGTDVCFAPVLTMTEASRHEHMAARQVLVTRNGVLQTCLLHRVFSRTPSKISEIRRISARGNRGCVEEWKIVYLYPQRCARAMRSQT